METDVPPNVVGKGSGAPSAFSFARSAPNAVASEPGAIAVAAEFAAETTVADSVLGNSLKSKASVPRCGIWIEPAIARSGFPSLFRSATAMAPGDGPDGN